MGVYTVELDSGGEYIQKGLELLGGAIGARMKAKKLAPIQTKQVVEGLFAEGKMMAPEDMWAAAKKIFPAADREAFESAYFGYILTPEQRKALQERGELPKRPEFGAPVSPVQMPGAAAPLPGSPPPAPVVGTAPDAAFPSGQVSSSTGTTPITFDSFTMDALKGKAVEKSSTGGIAPPSTGITAVDKALTAAVPNVTVPDWVPANVEDADAVVRAFDTRAKEGALKGEDIAYMMERAKSEGFGDFRGRLQQYFGYDPEAKATSYGMADFAKRAVINGMIGQIAGMRDLTKESAVLSTQIQQNAQEWTKLSQADRRLAADVLAMSYNLKAQLRGQDIQAKGIEYDALAKKADLELKKIGVTNDTARLVLTAAGLMDAAAGGGAGGGAGKDGSKVSDRWVQHAEHIERMRLKREAAFAEKDKGKRAMMLKSIMDEEKTLWAAMMSEDPALAAMSMMYLSSADGYAGTDVAEIIGQLWGANPEIKIAVDAALMAPNTAQRQAALLAVVAKADPLVQEWIKTQPPALQGNYRDIWQLTKDRGFKNMLVGNVEDEIARIRAEAASKVPTAPIGALGSTGVVATSTINAPSPGSPALTGPGVRSTVMNDITGGGSASPKAPDPADVIGLPATRAATAAQAQYASTIVSALDDATYKYFGPDASRPVEPHLIAAMIDVESDWNTKAVSPKNAQGLMQVMPVTQKEVGITDPNDPVQSIKGGTEYFIKQLARFKNLKLALIAYNAGPEVAEKVQSNPATQIPKETQDYLINVEKRYNERKTARTV